MEVERRRKQNKSREPQMISPSYEGLRPRAHVQPFMRRGFTWKLNAMSMTKNGRAAATGATRTAPRRTFAPNRITTNPRRFLFARIDAAIMDTIEGVAAKWRITRGEAIDRIVRKAVAA